MNELVHGEAEEAPVDASFVAHGNAAIVLVVALLRLAPKSRRGKIPKAAVAPTAERIIEAVERVHAARALVAREGGVAVASTGLL